MTCNCSGKKLLIGHTVLFPKDGLILARHDNTANELGNLGSRALTPIDIYYEPQIKSSKVQGERTGEGVLREGETSKGGTNIAGDSKGGERMRGYQRRSGQTGDESGTGGGT